MTFDQGLLYDLVAGSERQAAAERRDGRFVLAPFQLAQPGLGMALRLLGIGRERAPAIFLGFRESPGLAMHSCQRAQQRFVAGVIAEPFLGFTASR